MDQRTRTRLAKLKKENKRLRVRNKRLVSIGTTLATLAIRSNKETRYAVKLADMYYDKWKNAEDDARYYYDRYLQVKVRQWDTY